MSVQRVTKAVTDVTALLLAVAALIGALSTLGVGKFGILVATVPRSAVPILSAILLAFALGLQWRRIRELFRRGPVLVHPEAFNLGQEHLEGREEDVERLLRCLRNYPLTFLTGQSGAGKSAILQRGVLAKLRSDSVMFPVYVNEWGADWTHGPEDLLGQSIARALAETAEARVQLKPPFSRDAVVACLQRIYSELGRLPVLLFDQFDDYQTVHSKRFLRAERGTVLSAAELVEENPFWRAIANLLEAGQLRCLFATRDDAQWGLEAVRFREPEIYVLRRLERRYAARLLDRLSAGGNVARPELGFEKLKQRLVADLGPQGWVLPVQMQVAFRGLAGLRSLTVAEYERSGGLTGLEALHIRTQIAEAATSAHLDPSEVRKILLQMVDRAGQKTVGRTDAEILSALSGAMEPASLRTVLHGLEREDVIRRHSDPEQGETVWLLDHDYLVRSVLELDRREQRWALLLEESTRAFRASYGLWSRWNALLRPTEQLRLAFERLRGKLRYGQSSGFAFLSTARLVVNVWVVLIVTAALLVSSWGVQREATGIFSAFQAHEELTPLEVATLWELQRTRKAVRVAVLQTAFSSAGNAQRFNAHSDAILDAAMGLDYHERTRLLERLLHRHCAADHRSIDEQRSLVCATAAMRVSPASPHTLRLFAATVEHSSFADYAALLVSSADTDPVMVWLHKLPPATRRELADILVGELAAGSRRKRHAIEGVLVILSKDIPPAAAREACKLMAAAAGRASAGKGLPLGLLARLEGDSAKVCDREILTALAQRREPGALIALGTAVGALRRELDAELGKAAERGILRAMRRSVDADSRLMLAIVYSRIATQPFSDEVGRDLMIALESIGDSVPLPTLCSAVGDRVAWASPDLAANLRRRADELLERSHAVEYSEITALLRCRGTVDEADGAQVMYKHGIEAARRGWGYYNALSVARHGDALQADVAERLGHVILDLMREEPTDVNRMTVLSVLMRGLGRAPVALRREADGLMIRLLDQVSQAEFREVAKELASSAELTPHEMRSIIAAIIERIEQRRLSVEALHPWIGRLTSEEAERLAANVIVTDELAGEAWMGMGKRLDRAAAERLFARYRSSSLSLREEYGMIAAAVAQNADEATVLEALRNPTCSESCRAMLLRAVTQRTELSRETPTIPADSPSDERQWALIDWLSRRAGIDLEEPPPLPNAVAALLRSQRVAGSGT